MDQQPGPGARVDPADLPRGRGQGRARRPWRAVRRAAGGGRHAHAHRDAAEPVAGGVGAATGSRAGKGGQEADGTG